MPLSCLIIFGKASTGIEGTCSHAFDLASMDACSRLDLRPEQVSYLNDFSRLCPTKKYGVAFDRATRVAYADRAHSFISGTAAIDSDGQVMHRGDVMSQLQRALGLRERRAGTQRSVVPLGCSSGTMRQWKPNGLPAQGWKPLSTRVFD